MKDFSLKNYFLITIVLVVLILVLDVFIPGLDFLGLPISNRTASLLIDYGNGATRQFEGKVIKDMTVFDAFTAASQGGLKVESTSKGNGIVYLAVDGRSAKSEVLVNGRQVSLDKLNQTIIKKGDLIRAELP